MPKHMEKTDCKNCGHQIYYQFDKWEHFTRAYRPNGFPYTTIRCFAPGDTPISWYINNEQMTICGCETPEPHSLESTAKRDEE